MYNFFFMDSSSIVHNCAKYEGSKFNHIDRRAQIKKFTKMATILKNISYIDLIFHVHILGT